MSDPVLDLAEESERTMIPEHRRRRSPATLEKRISKRGGSNPS